MKWANDQTQQEFEFDEEPVGYPSITHFADKYLRLSQIRYKYWADEERWSWEGRIVMDFVDFDGKLLWRFPPDPQIPELYEIVRFSTSGIASAIQQFLNKVMTKS